ncbi:MAG: ATP-binding cassette domain-containing protein [Gammaproteobacteria bacterium]|nr:ATP-binding cassette domain-containing protein [Gammaproteobacteria bacterium]MDH5691905.1 ATP-binding cassette domain-containing protein [Gammaproteobacteria bacterium]
MTLLSLKNVSLSYGDKHLLKGVDFSIQSGERVCLIGRNGAGKSTLMKLLCGLIQSDEGEFWSKDTLRATYLEQELPEHGSLTIYELVAMGLGELGQILSEYSQLLILMKDESVDHMARLNVLQQKIDSVQGWNQDQKIKTILSRLSLDPDLRVAACSGGMKRRALLAQALVNEPDLLLLDEPTNHMDIAAISWLENFLLKFSGAIIFITHDRTFLRNLATRIVELDRGNLVSFPGNYDAYEKRKNEMLDAELKAFDKFDKKLAEEEVWIRKGIKARRTRNEGRVRALKEMRELRRQRVEKKGNVSFSLNQGDSSGKIVADLRHVSFAYEGTSIIEDFSTRILRGDRVGILGPNGCGKSTLLRLILGELAPSQGQVVLGSKLIAAYFDQHRKQLDLNKTVRENMSEGSDYVTVRDKSRHVISYLKDFLFPPQQIDSPVKTLSGGERNRLMLAKVFTLSSNLLVLDEPTNDLDVETLELLEEILADYEGTLLLVSHDRSFLDNVVTSTIVFEGEGHFNEYVGGYEDWLRQSGHSGAVATLESNKSGADKKKIVTSGDAKDDGVRKKLSYKETRELESLPGKIEKLEMEQESLQQMTAHSDFYKKSKEEIAQTLDRMKALEGELSLCYERWEELDQKGN